MRRQFRASTGKTGRRRLPIALGAAALMVAGLGQPLLAGAQADDNPLQPLIDVVNGNVTNVAETTTALQGTVDALTATGQEFGAQIGTIAQTFSTDPAAALAAIQSASNVQVVKLVTLGLGEALKLASQISAPSCATLGALAATLSPLDVLPLPYANYGPLADTVKNLDQGVSDALLSTYTQLFAQALTPVSLPPGTEAAQGYVTLAQTIVGLLKVNWRTTFQGPDGIVVRDTPGLLGLPTFIDVDRRTGVDICGIMTLDPTTLRVKQTIARVPLSDPNLPLQIQSQFLNGAVSPGYDTRDSKAPTSYETTTTLDGTTVDSKLLKPGATFEQTLNLTSALQFSQRSLKPPTAYRFTSGKAGGPDGNGTVIAYDANARSDKFTFKTTLGSITQSVSQTPGSVGFQYCTSAKGFCSNAPAEIAAAQTGSLHMLAGEVVTAEQAYTNIPILGSSPATGCTSSNISNLGNNARLTGRAVFLGQTTSSSAGNNWVNTYDLPASGCVSASSMIDVFADGFRAVERNVSYSGVSLLSAGTVTAKSGSILCPTGTTARAQTSIITTRDTARYFCSFPPANTAAPTTTGTPKVGTTLSSNRGTWTPAAPNLPTFAQQWQTCADAAGTGCANIAGATGTTYTPTAADQNKYIRVVVTGTNFDGTASAPSTPRGPIVP
ncbi:MAG: hypothetical protein ACT4QF_19595 [Sporichthyaceae bacterium]